LFCPQTAFSHRNSLHTTAAREKEGQSALVLGSYCQCRTKRENKTNQPSNTPDTYLPGNQGICLEDGSVVVVVFGGKANSFDESDSWKIA